MHCLVSAFIYIIRLNMRKVHHSLKECILPTTFLCQCLKLRSSGEMIPLKLFWSNHEHFVSSSGYVSCMTLSYNHAKLQLSSYKIVRVEVIYVFAKVS